ncbi:MAG: hypothetical protein H0U75_00470 [Legionella sp.]|nr:hypothetical protein [Legionella sp.]
MATKIGISQLTQKTPTWAKWMFRITFILTTALTAYIASTNLLSQNTKYEITLILKLVIDPIVYGVSKLFGVDVKQEAEDTPAEN